MTATSRLALVEGLTNEAGQPLVVLPWWRQAFAALEDAAIRELILWLPRQAGKTTLCAAMLLTTLLAKPSSYSILIAAGQTQAEAIFHRKVRRVFERWAAANGLSRRDAIITKRSIELIETGAKIEVLATEEATVTARSVNQDSAIIIDESRDVPDGVFGALAPSAIGGGGKIVLASTAGQPMGFFYDAVKNVTPETWLYHARENDNPYASQPMLNFLARRLGVLMPAAKRREIDNEFTEDGDAFIRPELLEAGIDDTLGETPASERPCFGFLDLSRKRDLTSLVLVLREAPRRAEVYDHLTVASVRVWDPKHSATGQIDFAEVRETLAGLPTRFPSLTKLLVDEGAEGGSVLPWAKAQPSLALKIEGYVATPVANMQLWGALIARLHAQSISFPRHERLIAELRNLRQETFSFGSKWRVIDASRKYHRDVSLALAGACHAAGYRGYGPATATHESVREKLGDEALRDSTPRGGFFGTRSEPVARLERVAAGVTSGDDGRGRRRFWRE